jgi:type II secretory pathway pseudopilin PulG
MKYAPRYFRRGLTLIEALTTIGVMAALLPVLLHGFALAGRIAESTRDTAQATALAQSQLERLIATGEWQNAGSGDETVVPTTFHWEASLTAFESETNVQTLTVTVRWARHGTEQNVALTSLVYLSNTASQSNSSSLMGGGLQ